MVKRKKEINSVKTSFSVKFFFVCCLVFSLWCLNIILLGDLGSDDRGAYGDMFGAVNALFSGLAFAGVIVAILMQSEELKLQRRELEQTREELSGQKKEFQEQNKTLSRQRFENTFFQMIALHDSVVDNFAYVGSDKVMHTGAKKLAYMVRGLNNSSLDAFAPDRSYKKYYGDYIQACVQDQNNLDPYFNTLSNLLEFIEASHLSNTEKLFYVRILKDKLSSVDIQLLFYQGLRKDGASKLKEHIEKHALFSTFPKMPFDDFYDAVRCYDVAAFGGEYPEPA